MAIVYDQPQVKKNYGPGMAGERKGDQQGAGNQILTNADKGEANQIKWQKRGWNKRVI